MGAKLRKSRTQQLVPINKIAWPNTALTCLGTIDENKRAVKHEGAFDRTVLDHAQTRRGDGTWQLFLTIVCDNAQCDGMWVPSSFDDRWRADFTLFFFTFLRYIGSVVRYHD